MATAETEHTEGEIAADLVSRIASGDTAAEEELVQRYSRGLSYMLRRLTRSPELAEDLHQETFRIILERLRGRELEEPAGFLGFLRGTAKNLVLAESRKGQRREAEGPEELEQKADPAPDQLATLLHAEDAQVVRELIGELAAERDRQILYRFYVAENDKEHICAELGLSSLHFNRVLFRARQRFKQLLESRGTAFFQSA